jgi:glycosyltransferase involved in cell wall biosynthesis
VCLVTLGDPATLTGGYLYHRRLAERAARHGARVRIVSVPAAPFPLPLLAAGATTRRIRRVAGQVVVVDSLAAAYLAPCLPRLPRPLAAIVHQLPGGMDVPRARAAVQAPLDLAVYARCELVLAASEDLRSGLLRAGVDPGRCRVAAPGRDPAGPAGETGQAGQPGRPADPAPADLRQGRPCALLSVGNWIPRKGLVDLLEAFAALPDGAATLHLVGRTDVDRGYARRVRRRLAEPALRGRVVVHGPLRPAAVAGLLHRADAFVLPARVEPYGTVYGEAMAAGLPVVGIRAGNLPHLATDGIEGLLVPPGDTAALGRALRALAEDGALRRRLGSAAARRAQALPTWEETTAAVIGALRELVPARRTPPAGGPPGRPRRG